MHVFLTGGTGPIGSAVVAELLAALTHARRSAGNRHTRASWRIWRTSRPNQRNQVLRPVEVYA
jgi:uncharacterized protein YbjT (DUF2867 family)